MTVRFFYVDESYDDSKFCLSAISIPHTRWRQAFEMVREHRRSLKQQFGMHARKEIHARDFVAGRGKVGDREIGKWHRTRIFRGLLHLVANLPEVHVFNVALNKPRHRDAQMDAWNRLVNRIERTMLEFDKRATVDRQTLAVKVISRLAEPYASRVQQALSNYAARALIIADEGREAEITKALRKMAVFNPIPSQFGGWQSGERSKNIATQRIIEDPVFKRSHQSHFLQLADCVAFALLKQEVPPTPNIAKYEVDKMFGVALGRVCFRDASPRDPLGIVRA